MTNSASLDVVSFYILGTETAAVEEGAVLKEKRRKTAKTVAFGRYL